jgi:hypothetical protein
MLCFSYYCFCFLSNKIRDKGRRDSAWKQNLGGSDRGGGGGRNNKKKKRKDKMKNITFLLL